MPSWLLKQLEAAFRIKDVKQIKFLNQCWFQYRPQNQDESLVNEDK